MMNATFIREQLLANADPEQARHSQRFFKTGPGEYAEGDLFCGLKTPQIRLIAKQGAALPLSEIEILLKDKVHEVRACALCIIVGQFKKADEAVRKNIIDLYLSHTTYINNWDLVDCSCGILGEWLSDKERSYLYRLADSDSLWEQRIAVVSTLPLIKRGDFKDILSLAKKLILHRHDLMHKAIGWMLREVGKKDVETLRNFLATYYRTLPRTTLRYAIERFPEDERKSWLNKA